MKLVAYRCIDFTYKFFSIVSQCADKTRAVTNVDDITRFITNLSRCARIDYMFSTINVKCDLDFLTAYSLNIFLALCQT